MEIFNTNDYINDQWSERDIFALQQLDARSQNSLYKMNIFSVGQLRKKREIFFNRNKRKNRKKIDDKLDEKSNYGVGKKGLKNILKAIKFISENFIEVYGAPTDDEMENVNVEREFVYYIPMKICGRTGQVDSRAWKGYTDLNVYLNNLADNIEDFKLKDYVNIIYENLSEIEKAILNYRLLYGKNGSKKKTLDELSEESNITRERVRQLEGKLIEKIELSIKSVGCSEIGKNWVKAILLANGFDNYGILNVSGLNYENFSSLFVLKVYELMFDGAEFGCVTFEKDLSILVYDKKSYNDYVIKEWFKNIDELYNEERIEKLQYNKEDLLIRLTMPNTNLLKNYGYEYCILNYLFYKYFICDLGGYFMFPENKKNLGALVVKEIDNIGKPIHFKELTKIMIEKYPEFNRNEGKVHTSMSKYCKYVGPGTYVSKDHQMKGGFIGDIAENYLEKMGKPVSFKKMEGYILKNAIVEKGSIRMRLTEDRRFIVEDGEVYLRKRKTENDKINQKAEESKDSNEEYVIYNLLKNSDGLSLDEISENLNIEKEVLQGYLVNLYKNKKIGYSIKNNKTIYNVLSS